jgi:hypothetical protein
MERKLLSSYRMSQDITGVPGELLRDAARTPGNMERLRAVSLASQKVDLGVEAFVMSKLRPYAPGPGFDHMIFVAKEGGMIRGIEDITPRDLSALLGMSGRILSTYEKNTEPDNHVAKEVIAINYHATPVDEAVFDRKLYAQSLRDLHIHVVGFRANDIQELSASDKEAITHDQYAELREPILYLVDRLVKIPAIKQRLEKDLTSLTKRDELRYAGIGFGTEIKDLQNPVLSQDLIQLHHNLQHLYQEVSQLFVDPDRLDETGMPTLLAPSLRAQKIEEFFQAIASERTSSTHEALRRAFLRLSASMKSGTEVQALSPQEKRYTPIFLRGFAYTLAIIRDPHTGALFITISPRILSTGNLLATLGYHKVTGDAPPTDWLEAKKRNEKTISEALSPHPLS